MPWYLIAVLCASTSVIVGLIWDVSWHLSIGRDSLWSWPHLAIYAGGFAAGAVCGWLALKTTFAGTDREISRSVRLWGFRAPTGAWVAIWGSLAMLVAGPFDDWWHQAYGLDVELLSVPHTLILSGVLAIQLGAMLMAGSWQNVVEGSAERTLQLGFAFAGGMLIATIWTFSGQYTWPNNMHGSSFYLIAAAAYPFVLFAVARAGRLGWPATAAVLVYTAVALAMLWILPLFPAQPRLAPILREVTHMVPPKFPLLLFAPALLIDLLLRRGLTRDREPAPDWRLAVIGGSCFVVALLIVQWGFSEFLLAEGSRNAFFRSDIWGYEYAAGDWQHRFWHEDLGPGGVFSPRVFALHLAAAFPLAIFSARGGLWWGERMGRVRR